MKLRLENFEHYFVSVWDDAIVQSFEHSVALPFFGIGIKIDLFQACGHCWVFQIYWRIDCSTFTASSLRIWNSSTVIPSAPLALFAVMLLKAHLTSHLRMSGSMWVITPCGYCVFKTVWYSSSVYSCHLLISSASVRCIPFLSHLCMKCSLCISNFLIGISGLSHSIIFLYFAFIT